MSVGVSQEARVRPASPDRSRLLALARSPDPWAFLGEVAQGTRDPAVVLMLAASLARLGLRTPARRTLDRLEPHLASHPDPVALRKALDGMADDAVTPADLEATLATNLAALRTRGVDIESPGAGVLFAGETVHRAVDGNVVTIGADGGISPLADLAGAARAWRESLGVPRADGIAPALVLAAPAGAAVRPFLIRAADEASPVHASGFRRAIAVVAEDERELLRALAMMPLEDALARERLVVFAGRGCHERLDAWLGERLEFDTDAAIQSLGTRTDERAAGIVAAINERRAKDTARVRERVAGLYRGRTRESWAARFRGALDGTDQPLRVLIPTWRFSTFVRHASADLARAIERAGHVAEVLVQPDDTTTLPGLAYARAIERLRPDLCVLVNYPRAAMGGAIPVGLPHACYVQDAMAHLFDEGIGRAQGELDFLVGHTHHELFDRYHWPIDRALPAAVVADATVFRARPRRPDQGLACEVAMVSHHSASPRELHESILRDGKMPGALSRELEEIYPLVIEASRRAMERAPGRALRELVEARVTPAHGEAAAAKVLRHWAFPVGERAFRHEAVEWAAAISRRRGWRLRLFGRGWESNAAFASFAMGELPHDDALRDAYTSAGACLHASFASLVHQRVMECALAGGLCLARLSLDAIVTPSTRLQAILATREPSSVEPSGTRAYAIADHPEAMATTALLQRLGVAPTGSLVRVHPARAAAYARKAAIIDEQNDPAYLFGDLAEFAFADEPGLERVLERAIERPAWRANAGAMVRRRVERSFTSDALVRRLLGFIARRLAEPSHAALSIQTPERPAA